MITFREAQSIVFSHLFPCRKEEVHLSEAANRMLAEDVRSDRPLPPFDRVAMDGIAVAHSSLEKGVSAFRCEAKHFAGMPVISRSTDVDTCIDTATGAVLPKNCDLVIPYELLDESDGVFTLKQTITFEPWKNVHRCGSDLAGGVEILRKGSIIDTPAITALASVGVTMVPVVALPTMAVISTGDELVPTDAVPLPHQIRQSNAWSIVSLLQEMKAHIEVFHLDDDQNAMGNWLETTGKSFDVLIFSGGVSMGKRDFIPEILAKCGVHAHFHKVLQRPGKPLWFGSSALQTVFGLPGNPVSTIACTVFYIRPWLERSMLRFAHPAGAKSGALAEDLQAEISHPIEFNGKLTTFKAAQVVDEMGKRIAHPLSSGGSGDFNSLIGSTGFLLLEGSSGQIDAGSLLPYQAFTWKKN